MPRVVKIGKSSRPGKVVNLSFPDYETLAFWKATADDPAQLAARVARFSRVLAKDVEAKPITSPRRLRRETKTSLPLKRPRVLGKLLIMPKRPK